MSLNYAALDKLGRRGSDKLANSPIKEPEALGNSTLYSLGLNTYIFALFGLSMAFNWMQHCNHKQVLYVNSFIKT